MNHYTMSRPLLDWTRINEWRDVIIDTVFEEFAPKRDRAWLLSVLQALPSWDDSGRLEVLRYEAKLDDTDQFLDQFARRLPLLFKAIRTVHFCRPLKFQTYKERGIVRLDPLQLQKDLRILIGLEHPEVTPEDIDQAISSVPLEKRTGRVFLGIDEREFLENAGHYAVYGSEYQLSICRKLVGDGRTNYARTLQRRGLPAYIVVHLPTTSIDPVTLRDLARYVIGTSVWSAQFGKNVSPSVGFGFGVEFDIPPQMIFDIVHAPHARDPWP